MAFDWPGFETALHDPAPQVRAAAARWLRERRGAAAPTRQESPA